MEMEVEMESSLETSGAMDQDGATADTSTLDKTSAYATVRTRSEYEKLVKNSIDSVKIKEELLDYEDDDPCYYNHHGEVFYEGSHPRACAAAATSNNNTFIAPSMAAISESPTNFDTDKTIGAPQGSRAYTAVRAARRAASCLRYLNSAPVEHERVGNGTFMHSGDERHIRTGIGSDLGTRINWTCSFGRPAGSCHTCLGGRHEALKSAEGGPVAILAADQSFPACLPASEGECLRVVRVEDGSLREVVLALVDCIGKHELSTGTIVLLGSVTHLATVGSAQYALDWVRSRFWLKDRLGDKVTIIPAPVVPTSGIEGISVVRSLIEVLEWFMALDSTEALLAKQYFQHFLTTHLGSTEHGVELNERQCLRLPVSLDSRVFFYHGERGLG